MKNREVRNEFGLDELNEQDVRNEEGPRFVVWAIAGLAAFAIFVGLAFYVSSPMRPPIAVLPHGNYDRISRPDGTTLARD